MNRITVVALALTAAAACSSVRVTTDYDPEVDFSGVGTYAWLDERSGVEGDRADVTSLLDRRIRRAVGDELRGKGIAPVARDEAQLLVSYHLGVEKKLDINTIHTGYGYGRDWYGAGGTSHTTVSEYEEGTLLIDFIDPSSKQLVWRGSGQARVRQSTSPKEREELVRKAVAEILASFPPKAD